MVSAGKILAFISVFIVGIGIGILIGSVPQLAAVPDASGVPASAQGPAVTQGTPVVTVTASAVTGVPTAAGTPRISADASVAPAASSPASASAATVISTPTPTPDPIVGTWRGSKTALFVYSGEAAVTFNADHTAYVSGFARGPGLDRAISTDFTWQNLGNSKYRGNYGSKSLDFVMSGNTLIMTINPAKLGISDQLNTDITIDLSRS